MISAIPPQWRYPKQAQSFRMKGTIDALTLMRDKRKTFF
jgi:hypothetical protein